MKTTLNELKYSIYVGQNDKNNLSRLSGNKLKKSFMQTNYNRNDAASSFKDMQFQTITNHNNVDQTEFANESFNNITPGNSNILDRQNEIISKKG